MDVAFPAPDQIASPSLSSQPTPAEIRALRDVRRRQKVTSVFTAEAIMFELAGFLEAHYGTTRGETVLDVGAGTRPYQALYGGYFERCVSTDVAHSQHDIQAVDVIASAESLPFDEGPSTRLSALRSLNT